MDLHPIKLVIGFALSATVLLLVWDLLRGLTRSKPSELVQLPASKPQDRRRLPLRDGRRFRRGRPLQQLRKESPQQARPIEKGHWRSF